ncbi:hypothetical protein C2R22_10475 [Salinigranum rubrum]|uniref:Uncharacterized protein n=1 Tax=Salinigranum rubrum TaxID=755307 RepID=A0A2I8VJC8_9EURY|nr:hypothetical protein [Salinigranum rubrum]AUV82021.1 hypothetical protein C2R22_10475 [Salinigranum rubrum]
MGLVSSEAVGRRLRGFSDERFVAFVAALWNARGAETRVVTGTNVVEARRGGQTRRLRVVTGRRVPSECDGVDALVLSRPVSAVRGTDAFEGRILDSDDVHAMLLYAVPRSAADDLCRRFFDRSLAEEREPSGTVTARAPEHSASLVVGLVGLTLLVASVFGGPILYGGTNPVFGAPDSVGADPADATTPDPTPENASDAGSESFESASFPPGLGPDGVTDYDALADAHAHAVTGQSYRLTITHREYIDGRPTAYRRETVSVAEPTVYRTELDGAGNLERGPLVIARVEAFADGETRYERRVVADEFDRSYTVDTVGSDLVPGVRNGEGRYADRVEQYVGWFLSVSESDVVDSFERDGTRYYWVRLGADTYAGVENSTGSALVDENGVVHEVRRQYDYPGSDGVSAAVSIRYTDFGTTTVSPPAWYEERVGATNATTNGMETNATNVTANATTAAENATAVPGTANATPTHTPTQTSTTATATAATTTPA